MWQEKYRKMKGITIRNIEYRKCENFVTIKKEVKASMKAERLMLRLNLEVHRLSKKQK